ncbi:hypothetical protein AaE_003586 [Aphanomyces astaci]|uniref:Uncharacterized protein n=1 Tax=Aphanomyces astaci TaxID=112090 RepID=A0A6A5AUY7_APHAT|nr:hypothetical protein AaE_003586 [Aphanomyces astaci]
MAKSHQRIRVLIGWMELRTTRSDWMFVCHVYLRTSISTIAFLLFVVAQFQICLLACSRSLCMKKSKPSTIGDDHAVVNVLTNTSLWLSIAQFQTGLPRHFHPIVRDIRVVAASMWDPHRLLGPQTFQEQSSIKYHAWFAEYGLHAVRVLQQKCMRDFVVYTSFIGHISSLATLLPTSLKFSVASVDLTRVWKFAARNGHLPVIQYLHMHQFPGCTSHVMDTAAGNGHLDIVSFLHSFRGEGTRSQPHPRILIALLPL